MLEKDKTMQAIQCKHPSESEYTTVKLIDPVDVIGKHYAVAVDIYDKRSSDIFMSLLNVLSRKDSVTLIVFGLHAEKMHFDMKSIEMMKSSVTDQLKLHASGLNTLVGVRYLEQIKTADEHIMITAGLHDSAPWNIESKVKMKLFSPGNSTSDNYCKGQTFVMDWDVTYFPTNGPYERLIRSVLDIKPSLYYDICLGGKELINCPPLPYGGYREVHLPYKTTSSLPVSCMLFNGTFQEFQCELRDDESIPYRSDMMKPCSMVE